MKLIKAIIRPSKLPDVLRALYQAEVYGLTVSRVRGHGGEVESVQTYRGTTVKMELRDKIMLDIGVSDEFVFSDRRCHMRFRGDRTRRRRQDIRSSR